MPQTQTIRIKHQTNHRLSQYKKKNKIKNKSEAIDNLLELINGSDAEKKPAD